MNNIIRVEHNKDNPYVIMNKGFFEDRNLSGKAKGILGYLLTKPDNWKVFISDLMNHFKDGETSIRAGLNELKKFNYMQRYPAYENKKISYWETVVYESPYPESQKIKRKAISNETETYLLVENLEVGIRTQVINNNNKYRKNHKNKRPQLTCADIEVLKTVPGFM
jgi:hypothetical protein